MQVEHLLIFATFFVYNVLSAALHGQCESNDDCGTIDTYCKSGTCVCREHFNVWFDSCVQIANPRIKCAKRHDCQRVLGVKSLCAKSSFCACKPFHHWHHGQCVKNRDLHDICEHDHQCYCGADCQDKIACIGKNCTCRPGHKPFLTRRCVDDPLFTPLRPIKIDAELSPRQSKPSSAKNVLPVNLPVIVLISWFLSF